MIALVLLTLPALDVDAFFADARRGGTDGSIAYQDPSPWERAMQGAWFTAVFAAADQPEAAARLAPLARLGGLYAVVGEAQGRWVMVVSDAPEYRHGSGAYLIRLGPVGAEAFVQAPHGWSDEGSFPIARELFFALDARALATNTVHRRGRAGEEPTVPGDADVAHRVESTFQMATCGWLRGHRRGTIVQVHGFADERVPFDVVASAGIPAGAGGGRPGWLEALGTALTSALPGTRVALFPPEGERLAGLTNVQGRAAAAVGARFLHLELGASLRRDLRRATARAGLAAALVEVLHAKEN